MQHPGHLLKTQFLDPLGLSPWALAKGIGVHVSRITRILSGERPITVNTAVRLGLYFQVPASWWLDLQTAYDLAQSDLPDELARVVVPYPELDQVVITPTGARRLSRERPLPRPETTVSTALLARLRARAGSSEAPATPATAESVVYENGFRALVRK